MFVWDWVTSLVTRKWCLSVNAPVLPLDGDRVPCKVKAN